jgi:hypothetical protein
VVSTVERPVGTATSGWTTRRIVTDALLVLATVLAVLAIVAVWANRQLLNPDNWGSTSTSLLQNQKVREATANYLVDQLYSNVDVAAAVGNRLPEPLQPLAAPVAGALRNGAVQATELALSRPAVQDLWTKANRRADQALVTIVNGGNRQVSINGNEVTLNLASILDDVAARLGISADVGSKLPPHVATLVVMRSNQLKLVQDAGGALKGLAVILYIVVVLLWVIAVAIARGRRRKTLMAVGWSGIIAGLIVLLARGLIVRGAANSLAKDESVRPAVRAVASIGTGMLSETAGALILVAAVLVIAAWFAGPSRFAVPARRWLAPHVEANPVGTYVVVIGLLLLIFIWQPIPATSTPLGMIVFTVLAVIGVEVLRRQNRAEFGSAPPVTGDGMGAPPVLNEPLVATSVPPPAIDGEPAPQEPLAP